MLPADRVEEEREKRINLQKAAAVGEMDEGNADEMLGETLL